MTGQRKIIEFISLKLPFNRKISNHFLKPMCITELSWNVCVNKIQMTRYAILLQSTECISNEQPCSLET